MYVCARLIYNILNADSQSLSVIVFIEGLSARRMCQYIQTFCYNTACFCGCVTCSLTLGEEHEFELICGNKMPTRCNRGFYCRSYCLLNMFRASLCLSSGAQEYYTVVAACGISCCSILQTGHITFSSTPDQQLGKHSTKYHRQQPLYNTPELLTMGIVMPETC